MPRFELEVCIRGIPGVVDSEWIPLTSGVSVLTGRNNVGKSRILRTISAQQIGARLHDGDISIVMETDRVGFPYHYAVRGGEKEFVAEWEESGNGKLLKLSENERQGFGTPPHFSSLGEYLPEMPRLLAALARIVYLPPQRVIRSTVQTQPIDQPNPTGEDLVNVIYYHRNAETEEYGRLVEVMKVLSPEIDMILTHPIGQHQVTLTLVDHYSGERVSLDDAGTGVAQTLHLVASVLCLPPGRIFLIDEPHAFLHLTVERLLVAFLREHDEHWYLCATHSPVFINAAEPQHTWLVTRDEAGTCIHSVFDEALPRREVLQELGIQPSDVAFAEHIIFGEGRTEEQVFPHIFRQLGWDPIRKNYAVIGLGGTSHAPQFARAIEGLSEILQVSFTVCLDGDAASKYSHLPYTRFLAVNELEEVFLADPHAIRECLLLDFDDPSMPPRDEVACNWPVPKVEAFIAARRRDKPDLQASKILGSLAREMGTSYEKTLHGPVIGRLLSREAAELLRPTFADLFEPAE